MQVTGQDPRRGRHRVMERVCFIADVGVLPRWIKVQDAARYTAGIHPGFNQDRFEAMLAETKISKSQRVKQLSKGMVTQLHLALVMAIEVDLLVLDEPTIGLDILYRKAFYEKLLNDYFDHETSIVISTHQVEEIENILTDLMFINEGRIILDTTMDSLADDYVELLTSGDNANAARNMGPIAERDIFGKSVMLFEKPDRERLAELDRGRRRRPRVCSPPPRPAVRPRRRGRRHQVGVASPEDNARAVKVERADPKVQSRQHQRSRSGGDVHYVVVGPLAAARSFGG